MENFLLLNSQGSDEYREDTMNQGHGFGFQEAKISYYLDFCFKMSMMMRDHIVYEGFGI